ncbi:hypothetical protein K501DRAFT_154406, partial [Backusella circina FSU 941]
GMELGFERLVKLTNRNVVNEMKEISLEEVHDEPSLIEPGARVVRVRHHKHSKLDSNYQPEEFTVVAAFPNRTYQLIDSKGRLLKR